MNELDFFNYLEGCGINPSDILLTESKNPSDNWFGSENLVRAIKTINGQDQQIEAAKQAVDILNRLDELFLKNKFFTTISGNEFKKMFNQDSMYKKEPLPQPAPEQAHANNDAPQEQQAKPQEKPAAQQPAPQAPKKPANTDAGKTQQIINKLTQPEQKSAPLQQKPAQKPQPQQTKKPGASNATKGTRAKSASQIKANAKSRRRR